MNQLSLLLLVDSDPKGLETLKYGFEREGCTVAGTSRPEMAPEMVRTTAPQLAVIAVRDDQPATLNLIGQLRGRPEAKGLPVVTVGPTRLRRAAMAAGASDFLSTPLFFRDVISVGKLMLLIEEATAAGPGEVDLQARLSEYYGLYYLLRAISGTGRSGILQLSRGNKKGELRFSDGAVTSAQVGALQGFPALHHLLLWEEAALSLKLKSVLRRGQFTLSPGELLEECERFLRDFAHAARDLGVGTTVYVQSNVNQAHWAGLVASDVGPLLRLFDGHRTLSEVVEESPFRIFDTLRVLKRLLDSGGLAVQAAAGSPATPRKTSRTGGHAPLRPAARPTPSQLDRLPDQRTSGGDRRKSSRQRSLASSGVSATPAPRPAPIPLTVRKTSPTPLAGGHVAARRQSLTPPPSSQPIGDAPTVQMKLDPVTRRPTPRPLVANTPPPVALVAGGNRRQSPQPVAAHSEPKPEPKPDTKNKLRRSSPRLTPTSTFDAIEADFFAREADLYKKEAVDSFEDLERGTDPRLRRPAQNQPHSARKKR